MKIVFVDTETTGLDRQRDEIIELAAIEIEYPSFEPKRFFYQRFQPSRPVSFEAAAINGYTPEAWKGAPRLDSAEGREALARFVSFVNGARWVGSMPQFDFDMIERARVGAPRSVLRRIWDSITGRTPLPIAPLKLASHRLVDVGSIGALLILAGLGSKGGLDEIFDVLGLELPDASDSTHADLVRLTGGRVGPHTAMGDALRTLAAFYVFDYELTPVVRQQLNGRA